MIKNLTNSFLQSFLYVYLNVKYFVLNFTGRHLKVAYREDKKFDDSWRDLCDWLDEGEMRLKAKGNGTKHDLEELQVDIYPPLDFN